MIVACTRTHCRCTLDDDGRRRFAEPSPSLRHRGACRKAHSVRGPLAGGKASRALPLPRIELVVYRLLDAATIVAKLPPSSFSFIQSIFQALFHFVSVPFYFGWPSRLDEFSYAAPRFSFAFVLNRQSPLKDPRCSWGDVRGPQGPRYRVLRDAHHRSSGPILSSLLAVILARRFANGPPADDVWRP